MPQRNIYVKEEDEEVFEKAKTLFEDKSLSETVVKALKVYTRNKESNEEEKHGEFRRTRIPVGRMPRGEAPDRWIEFIGRTLAIEGKSISEPETDLQAVNFVIYQGTTGNFILTRKGFFDESGETDEKKKTNYVVGDTIEEIKLKANEEGWEVPESLLEEAKEGIGGQIIERPLRRFDLAR